MQKTHNHTKRRLRISSEMTHEKSTMTHELGSGGGLETTKRSQDVKEEAPRVPNGSKMAIPRSQLSQKREGYFWDKCESNELGPLLIWLGFVSCVLGRLNFAGPSLEGHHGCGIVLQCLFANSQSLLFGEQPMLFFCNTFHAKTTIRKSQTLKNRVGNRQKNNIKANLQIKRVLKKFGPEKLI